MGSGTVEKALKATVGSLFSGKEKVLIDDLFPLSGWNGLDVRDFGIPPCRSENACYFSKSSLSPPLQWSPTHWSYAYRYSFHPHFHLGSHLSPPLPSPCSLLAAWIAASSAAPWHRLAPCSGSRWPCTAGLYCRSAPQFLARRRCAASKVEFSNTQQRSWQKFRTINTVSWEKRADFIEERFPKEAEVLRGEIGAKDYVFGMLGNPEFFVRDAWSARKLLAYVRFIINSNGSPRRTIEISKVGTGIDG